MALHRRSSTRMGGGSSIYYHCVVRRATAVVWFYGLTVLLGLMMMIDAGAEQDNIVNAAGITYPIPRTDPPVWINEVNYRDDSNKGQVEFVCKAFENVGEVSYWLYAPNGKYFDGGKLKSVCDNEQHILGLSSETIHWKDEDGDDGIAVCITSTVLGPIQFLGFGSASAGDNIPFAKNGDCLNLPVEDSHAIDYSPNIGYTCRLIGFGDSYDEFSWDVDSTGMCSSDGLGNMDNFPNSGQIISNGTRAPTRAPTAPPTAAPTPSPTTAAPTPSPTTAKPTPSPTTAKPTASPPTRKPTEPPTRKPTEPPTRKPTEQPTCNACREKPPPKKQPPPNKQPPQLPPPDNNKPPERVIEPPTSPDDVCGWCQYALKEAKDKIRPKWLNTTYETIAAYNDTDTEIIFAWNKTLGSRLSRKKNNDNNPQLDDGNDYDYDYDYDYNNDDYNDEWLLLEAFYEEVVQSENGQDWLQGRNKPKCTRICKKNCNGIKVIKKACESMCFSVVRDGMKNVRRACSINNLCD